MRRYAFSALPLLLVNIGFAQAAAPASPTDSAVTDEPVVLSPFVVDASQDKGYRATKTLAGSRISTDLKDVAASVSVVTKVEMNDIGAVGINDILSYSANTEGTRDFTATTPTLGRPSDDVSSNPQGANRLRGLFSADITRDYFYTIGSQVGFDTYNLDEITINRGPNSVLAGLGSPAGIINYSPMLAGLTKNANEVAYRFGSWGDKRATFNSNIVAKPGELAFRVAGSAYDQGFKQQPAYNKDRRLYATTTYKPWSKTTIRAGYEHVSVKSNRPNTLTPEDDVTQWVTLGKPSYDRNSTAAVSPWLWRDGNLPTVFYSKNGTIDSAINTNTGYYFNQQNLTGVGIWTPIRMNSNKYLQLDKVNTSPSNGNQKLETETLSVDQEILPNLQANVSYLHEKIDGTYLNLFRPEYANYEIDVNLQTPWGAPNPHYGETYMQFRGLDNKQTDHNTNRVARATATYELDLTKHNKWFGHYRATGFVEDRRTETEHMQYTAKRADIAAYLQETGARYYLGGSATAPATALPQPPGLVTAVPDFVFDSGSGTYKPDTLTNFYPLKSDNKAITKLSSSAIVLQGYLWDDKIVGMFGLRRDKDQAANASSVEGGQTDPRTGLIPPAPPYGPLVTVSKQTKTYGVVIHPLKWLSLHYNHAENFIPNAGSIDLLGHTTPSPTGLGKDYGFSVSLLDDKLNAKLNWFELTAASGNAGNPANFPLAQWNMTFMDLVVEPELAKLAGIPYKQGVAPGIIVGDPRIAYTADNVSKGLELEITYNVTKNWRLMANISKQEAKQTNIAPALTTFIEERLAYWKSIPALWTGLRTQNNPWGLTQTGQEHFNQFLLGSYVGYKSVDGQPSTQLRKWHANALTNYDFTSGPLNGFNLGGGVRYLEKAVIGLPAITDAGGTVTALDLAHPYYSPGYVAFDAWVGYRRKIFNDKYVINFQLNGRDLQESGGFRAIVANSDGQHAVYSIVQPRSFYLTTKLEF